MMNHLNNEGMVNPYGMVGGSDDGVRGPVLFVIQVQENVMKNFF